MAWEQGGGGVSARVRPQEDWAPEGTSSWGDWDPGAATGPVDCLHPAARWIRLVHLYSLQQTSILLSQRGELDEAIGPVCVGAERGWLCVGVYLWCCTCVFMGVCTGNTCSASLTGGTWGHGAVAALILLGYRVWHLPSRNYKFCSNTCLVILHHKSNLCVNLVKLYIYYSPNNYNGYYRINKKQCQAQDLN